MKYSTICGTPKSHLGKLRLLAIAIGSQALFAQQALAGTLDHLSYTTLPGNQQQIAFQLSDPVNTPQTFEINEPAMIAIDLMGTTNALDKRVVPVGVGNLESVDIVETDDRTRVVLNLGEMTGYQTTVEGDRLLITLDADENAVALDDTLTLDEDATALNNTLMLDENAAALAAAMNETLTLDDTLIDETAYTDAAGPDELLDGVVQQDASFTEEYLPELAIGESTFSVDDALPIAVTEFVEDTSDMYQDDGLTVEIPSSLPLDYEAPTGGVESTILPIDENAITVETGAPIEEYIEDLRTPPAPEMPRINYEPNYDYQPNRTADSGIDYSSPNKDVFNNTPEAIKEVNYNGEELSLNFQDIEIRSVLQLLADFTDLNIVVSDTVDGKLTLRLKNVPWDQALDIILRTKGLDKRRSGNVVMVAPASEIAAAEAAQREAAKDAIALEPLRTEFVQVNYAKADEVAAILKSETGGLLSERGNVTIDDRTNTILVNDTSDVLGKVRALVTRLDIPVRQVLIESRIVIATDDFNREMGSRFGISRDTTGAGESGIALSGNNVATTQLINDETVEAPDRYNVNLPSNVRNGSLGLAFAKLPFGTLIELELSAMQAEGRGEVISTPRVITANQREAYIEQGVEIPYQEASSSGASSTSFRKAVLGLRVKPQITPDERIIIDLTVNKDTVGEVFGGIPSIDTREVNTQVLVANGETVVLGGIFEQSVIQQRDQVPFFGDLPLVGKLFQHNVNEDDKSELLVFVTPKIVNDGTSNLDR